MTASELTSEIVKFGDCRIVSCGTDWLAVEQRRPFIFWKWRQLVKWRICSNGYLQFSDGTLFDKEGNKVYDPKIGNIVPHKER
jgi:hypothetical protein